jgi:hypothetical protein
MGSKDNLSNLLDAMLDDASTQMAAEAAVEAEARKVEKAPPSEPAVPPGTIDDIEDLTGLPDEDVQKILAKAQPDDILIVLAAGSDALQRRLLANLSRESVAWVRGNLQHIDEVNAHEKASADGKVLKVVRELLAAGELRLPEPESVGTDEAPDPVDKDLRDLLTELVRVAQQAGPAAVTEVAEADPLLSAGLPMVVEGQRGTDLRRGLAKVRAQLERDYGERLLMIEEALVAMAEGEAPDVFRKRLFDR